MNKFKVFGLVAVTVLFVGVSAQAAEFRFTHDRGDRNISISTNETHKNLYAVGASVNVNGNIAGDLFAAGGMVTVNGSVEKDLSVAGGNLNINGAVGDDLRIAGGNISINGPVNSDLLGVGGNITVAQKASVGGDLVIAGGNVVLDSNVNGKADVRGGEITINGKITGDLVVSADQQLIFGPTSEVTGKITYKGPSPAIIKDGAKIGIIDYTKIPKRTHRGGFLALLFVSTLLKIIMLIAVALVICWLVPGKTSAVVKQALNSPWPSLGIGSLVLVASPILAILLMVTVVGMYLGIIVFLIFGLLIILSSVLSLFYVGNLVWGWIRKEDQPSLWRDLLVGALVTLVLGFIPFLGWLVLLVLWLITLGALFTHWRKETIQS